MAAAKDSEWNVCALPIAAARTGSGHERPAAGAEHGVVDDRAGGTMAVMVRGRGAAASYAGQEPR